MAHIHHLRFALSDAVSLLKDAETVQNAQGTIFWGTILALILLILAGLFITRKIAGPLNETFPTAERMARGDRNVRMSTGYRIDEIGALVQTFSRMSQSLASEILAATTLTQMGSGATEASAAARQSAGAAEQAEQTAQEGSQKVRKVTESAQKSAQISPTGKKVLENTIGAMIRIRQQVDSIAESAVRLSQQSQAVGGIIAGVNDLAEESSLLAVNAAMEAAKAGQHGRGFAMVAQRIKSLAEKSKQATARARMILGHIQNATGATAMTAEHGSKATEAGIQQSTPSGESIRILADSIAEAAQAAAQIAASAQRQLVEIDRLALAMENIRQASMQNAASSKQAKKTVRDLHDLGQRLKQLVEQY